MMAMPVPRPRTIEEPMSVIRSLVLAVALGVSAMSTGWAADTIEWRLGQTIRLEVLPSLPSSPEIKVKTVIFPNMIVDFQKFHQENDLEIVPYKNSLTLRLLNPSKRSFPVQVYDANGNMFMLEVVPSTSGNVENQTFIRPVGIANPDGTMSEEGPALPPDRNAYYAAMFRAMAGVQNPVVRSGRVTSMVDGKIIPGRIIYEDDHVSVVWSRVFQGYNLMGYEYLMTVKASTPQAFDPTRLWRPGIRAIWMPSIVSREPSRMSTQLIEPAQTVRIFMVGVR
jgi:hypothetical protein